jgi:hypothetical protein
MQRGGVQGAVAFCSTWQVAEEEEEALAWTVLRVVEAVAVADAMPMRVAQRAASRLELAQTVTMVVRLPS